MASTIIEAYFTSDWSKDQIEDQFFEWQRIGGENGGLDFQFDDFRWDEIEIIDGSLQYSTILIEVYRLNRTVKYFYDIQPDDNFKTDNKIIRKFNEDRPTKGVFKERFFSNPLNQPDVLQEVYSGDEIQAFLSEAVVMFGNVEAVVREILPFHPRINTPRGLSGSIQRILAANIPKARDTRMAWTIALRSAYIEDIMGIRTEFVWYGYGELN